MRIASIKTLSKNKQARIRYAYNAMERQSLHEDEELAKIADDALVRLHTMPKEESMKWAYNEIDFQECGGWN